MGMLGQPLRTFQLAPLPSGNLTLGLRFLSIRGSLRTSPLCLVFNSFIFCQLQMSCDQRETSMERDKELLLRGSFPGLGFFQPR